MRALWQGFLSFGLVNIPVRLYPATEERKLDFNYLRKKDLCPIRNVRVCERTGEEVAYENIVRGYKYAEGKWIIVDDEDFRKTSARKTNMIDVFEFVDLNQIDPNLYEKPYYLEPAPEARKAYALLREALTESGKVGIARLVLRSRERLAVVRPLDHLITLTQIRFAGDIRRSDDLDIPTEKLAPHPEIDVALDLIKQMSGEFELEKYRDTYAEEIKKIINQKAKGIIPPAPEEIPVPVTDMEDIIAKLQESLQHAKAKDKK